MLQKGLFKTWDCLFIYWGHSTSIFNIVKPLKLVINLH